METLTRNEHEVLRRLATFGQLRWFVPEMEMACGSLCRRGWVRPVFVGCTMYYALTERGATFYYKGEIK